VLQGTFFAEASASPALGEQLNSDGFGLNASLEAASAAPPKDEGAFDQTFVASDRSMASSASAPRHRTRFSILVLIKSHPRVQQIDPVYADFTQSAQDLLSLKRGRADREHSLPVSDHAPLPRSISSVKTFSDCFSPNAVSTTSFKCAGRNVVNGAERRLTA
jgi:hypothetical protein